MGEAYQVQEQHARRDLVLSALLLALLFAAVLCGLAYDENWRKLLRVGLAASVYLSALLLLTRRWRGPLPFWPFAVAAAAAELSSGWLRTRVADGMTFWLAPTRVSPRAARSARPARRPRKQRPTTRFRNPARGSYVRCRP